MAKKRSSSSILNQLLLPIVMLVAGGLLIYFKSGMLNIALYIIGALLIVAGIVHLIKKNVLSGIINLVIGIAVILIGGLLINIAVLIIGIILLVYGIYSIIKVLVKSKSKIANLISPIVITVVGALLVWGKFSGILDIILIICGVCLIVYAIYQTILVLTKK